MSQPQVSLMISHVSVRKCAGVGTVFASPRQNFSNKIPVSDLNISKLPTQNITILLYHKCLFFQLSHRKISAVSHQLPLRWIPSESSTGPGIFQRNSTDTFACYKSKSKCYLQAGSIFSKCHKTDDGTSSQLGTETLQRLRGISQWSPSACSLILPTLSAVLCQMFAAFLTYEASLAFYRQHLPPGTGTLQNSQLPCSPYSSLS